MKQLGAWKYRGYTVLDIEWVDGTVLSIVADGNLEKSPSFSTQEGVERYIDQLKDGIGPAEEQEDLRLRNWQLI